MGAIIIALLLFGLAVGIAAARLVYGRDKSIYEATLTFQALLTGAGLVLAGYWYFIERKGSPHADVSQSVEVIKLNDKIVAAEVTISIKNVGHTLVEISQADIRLQRVAPFRHDATWLTPEILAKLGVDEWPARTDLDKD